ncbi:hypothetical protein AALP_AA8G088900 [Arabis alpina]|uniref:CHCH domain-containing protein n=1 Tax=Arabis alpina TaxID=50452 RepID=A0A087G5V7_ARAAL|nr:hypothetical protein AALP_AA8G088900 [Arabis alpina]
MPRGGGGGRRSGGGGFGGGRSDPPRPRPVAASSPAPKTVKSAPPPATAQASNGGGSMLGNLGTAITDGIGLGVGSSIAHRAADFVFGPRTYRNEVVMAAPAASPAADNTKGSVSSCDVHSMAFQDCVNKFGSDISKCQSYMDMLTECKKSSGAVMAA